jgi:hypothetical protein
MIKHIIDFPTIEAYHEAIQPVLEAIYKTARALDADLYCRLRGIYDYTMIDHTPEYLPDWWNGNYRWTRHPAPDQYIIAEELGSGGRGYLVYDE